MKVICDRAALLEAIGLVSSVAASRTPKPQLTCVRLSATKDDGVGELNLSATDAEISLTLRLGSVDVSEPGETLVPAQKLSQIISAEDNDPTLTITSDGDLTTIKGADAEFKLHGYPASDFPPIADFQGAIASGSRGAFSLPAGNLSTVVSRTIFAAARENSRYAINGVLFKKDGKKLELVATDGRRLAHCSAYLPASGAGDEPVACIVPAKALGVLQKLIVDDNEPINIAVTDNQIVFGFGEDAADARAVLSSNLVEGAFPPYEDVIPKDQDIRVGFDRDVLFSAVKRAALLTNEESRGVRMAFTADDKKLQLSSRSPEMGEAHVEVGLASYEGGDIEIGFNPGFINEALKVIDDPQVVIELKATNKPGLLRSGSDFVYVVMPVNLQ